MSAWYRRTLQVLVFKARPQVEVARLEQRAALLYDQGSKKGTIKSTSTVGLEDSKPILVLAIQEPAYVDPYIYICIYMCSICIYRYRYVYYIYIYMCMYMHLFISFYVFIREHPSTKRNREET